MDEYKSLSHTKWECKDHVVFIPKGWRKTLFGQLRQHLGEVFHRLMRRRKVGSRRPSVAGPRAHVDLDPSKIRSAARGRLYQGKARHPHRPCVWRKETKFRWPKFLGSGLF